MGRRGGEGGRRRGEQGGGEKGGGERGRGGGGRRWNEMREGETMRSCDQFSYLTSAEYPVGVIPIFANIMELIHGLISGYWAPDPCSMILTLLVQLLV